MLAIQKRNLDRVDASGEWLAIMFRMAALVGTPHVNEITEHLDAVHDASLERSFLKRFKAWSIDN